MSTHEKWKSDGNIPYLARTRRGVALLLSLSLSFLSSLCHLSLHICCALFLYPPSARLSVCVSAIALVCVLLLSQTDFATHPVSRTAATTTANFIINIRSNNNNVIIDVVVGVCRVYTEIRKIHLWLSYPFCCCCLCCLRCRCCFVPVSGRRPRSPLAPAYSLVLLMVLVSAFTSASACSNFSCVRPTSLLPRWLRIASILETAAFFSSPKQGAPLDRLLRLLNSAEVHRMGSDVYNQQILIGASNGYWWVHSMGTVGYIRFPLLQMCKFAVSKSLYGFACVCVYHKTVFCAAVSKWRNMKKMEMGKKWATNYAMFCETTKFSPRRRGCCAFTLVFHLIFNFKITLVFLK